MREAELRFPKPEDDLQPLWLSCFPEDTDGYCEFFLQRWFRPDRCLVLSGEETVQSMVHLFTAELLGQGSGERFLYLYAIGTAPAFRGRGNLGRLLQGCQELARSRGLSGILLTSAVGLEPLYEHYGLEPCAVRYETKLELHPTQPLPWESCDYPMYSAMRREYLASLPSAFAWEPESDRFFYEVQSESGSIMQWREDGRTYYAVTGSEDDMPTLLETNHPLTQDFFTRIAASMGDLPAIKVCSPTLINPTSEAVCFGHWMRTDGKLWKQNDAYLNLIAD